MDEVIDVEGHTIGQTDSAFDPERLLDAYRALFGPGATERTFRGNVRRLWTSWADLLRDTTVRGKTPRGVRPRAKAGLEAQQKAVLTSMKAYNDWRQDVLALPEGGIGPESIDKYRKWLLVYARLRDQVQRKTAVRSAAPEDIRAVKPKGGGFWSDITDSFLLVGVVVGGAWLIWGGRK